MKRYSRWILIVCMIFFFTISLPPLAHADGDPGDPCGDPMGPDANCPIDSGVVFLLIAGAGYGIKKVIDARKSSATPDEKG